MRWRYAGASDYGKVGAGKNPPRGAILSYHLAEKPEGEVVLEVLDAKGRLVGRLSSVPRTPFSPPDHPDWSPETEMKPDLEVEPGMNRASWDLTCEGSKWIPGARTDFGDPRRGFLVPPGDYTLRLTIRTNGGSAVTTTRVKADRDLVTGWPVPITSGIRKYVAPVVGDLDGVGSRDVILAGPAIRTRPPLPIWPQGAPSDLALPVPRVDGAGGAPRIRRLGRAASSYRGHR